MLDHSLKQQSLYLSASLPEKRFWGRFDPSFLKERMEGLQAYLDELLRDPSAAEMPILQQFFKIPLEFLPESSKQTHSSSNNSSSSSNSSSNQGVYMLRTDSDGNNRVPEEVFIGEIFEGMAERMLDASLMEEESGVLPYPEANVDDIVSYYFNGDREGQEEEEAEVWAESELARVVRLIKERPSLLDGLVLEEEEQGEEGGSENQEEEEEEDSSAPPSLAPFSTHGFLFYLNQREGKAPSSSPIPSTGP